ncbi:MAG: S26 family signal peptidase, partial [Bacteroidaceae bacterium]|nr:S26 family signal peptidase [Bacteroidaceae bacterium]
MSETEKKTEAAKQEAIKETTLPTPDPKTPIRPDDKPEPDPRTPVKELLEQCAEDKAARRLKRKRVVKFVIVLTLYLLFLVWVQSWLGLLVVPFIYDAYISRKIDWYWWRKSKNSALRYVMGWVDAIVFALVAIYFLNQFFFQNYVIPSSSLEKTLLTGDYLLVSKVSYGPRIPQTPLTMPLTQHTLPVVNTKSYLEWPHWEYRRVKGLGEVRRGDIVVFNYPAGDTVALLCQNQDYYRMAYQIGAQATCVLPTQEMDYATQQQIFSGLYATGKQVMATNPQEFGEIVARPVDRRENYVKRCVALPGDTFLMRNDVIYINGKAQAQPENVQLGYVVSFREYP